MFAPKKDETVRSCIDYRNLTDVTARRLYLISRVHEFIDSVGHTQVFSTLGHNSGYWKIEMNKAHREETSFTPQDFL